MKFVAVTSCPTGIAHTYMAAESLEQAALEAGHEIVVETQGAGGAERIDPAVMWRSGDPSMTAPAGSYQRRDWARSTSRRKSSASFGIL